MLFAQSDATPWIIAAGALATAVAGALGTIIGAWSKTKREDRADTIKEWKELTDALQARIDSMADNNLKLATTHAQSMHEMTVQLNRLRDSEVECQKNFTEAKTELRILRNDIQRLQGFAGDELPPTIQPGLIIAEMDGTIRIASPTLTPLLHWLPEDLVGQNLEILVPEEYRDRHKKAIEKLLASGQAPQTRILEVEALTKEGKKVKVTTTIKGWRTTSGSWMLSGEIKPRGPDLIEALSLKG